MSLTGEILLTALTPSIGLAGLTWIGTKLRERVPERQRWRFYDAPTASVCIAQSVTSKTGVYFRPSTGIGQVRALALIAPSLSHAYPKFDTQRLCFPAEFRTEMERDVIVLGGPKHNDVSAEVLTRIEKLTGVNLTADKLIIPGQAPIDLNSSQNSPSTFDYGVVARLRNPFSAKPHMLVLLAGGHTYGVVAAARYFAESMKPLSKPYRNDFVAVVRSDIRNGHVLPPAELFFTELSY